MAIAGNVMLLTVFATVDRKGVAYKLKGLLSVPRFRDPVWHRQYRGFSGIVLRRKQSLRLCVKLVVVPSV